MRTMKKGAKVSIGGKKAPIVMGGTQHRQATSFTRGKLDKFEKTQVYREQGIVWIAPTRGQVHTSVVVSWLSLQWPMNHFRSPLLVTEGYEVGAAYTGLVKMAMNRVGLQQAGFPAEYAKMIADCPFILTTEEDNILPQDAIPKLFEAMYTCPDCSGPIDPKSWKCEKGHRGYDAVSGLYWVKSDPPMPMAYGRPNGRKKTLDFNPQSVRDAIRANKVIEVNGIGMGCAIFRKELFRKVKNTKKNPWFKTTPGNTQDLYFCKRAKLEAKARFGVHAGVRVAHFEPHSKTFF